SQRIKVGMNINISLDQSDEGQTARVIAIDPKVDEALRTVKVRAQLPNKSGKMMPGMFERVDVPLGETMSITVPTEALIPFIGGRKVFLLKNGIAVEKEVNTGFRSDKSVEIVDGVTLGDTIVVSGLMNLKNGQAIQVNKLITK